MPETSSNQRPNQAPTPLRADEVLALVGSAMIVVGAFLPALEIGILSSNFLDVGNVFAMVVIGLAASAAWSVAMRRCSAVWPVGLVLLLFVLADLLLVWNHGLRTPRNTLWGPLKFQIEYPAWVALVGGSTLITSAGFRARWLDRQMPASEVVGHSRSGVGIVLMLLGILYMVGVFLDGFRVDRVLEDYGIEPERLRWPTLIVSASIAVTAFHVPRWNESIARLLLLAAGAVFGLLCVAAASNISKWMPVVFLAWLLGLTVLLLTNVGQRFSKLAKFLIIVGTICIFVLYLAQGELLDLFVFTGPTMFLLALGWALQEKSNRFNLWIAIGLILCAGVCVSLLIMGVPNEFVESFGLNRPEEVVLVLCGLMLFGFGLYAVRAARPADSNSTPAASR